MPACIPYGMGNVEDLTCPECGDTLGIDDDWMLVAGWKEGTTVSAGESIQGDYAHEECV